MRAGGRDEDGPQQDRSAAPPVAPTATTAASPHRSIRSIRGFAVSQHRQFAARFFENFSLDPPIPGSHRHRIAHRQAPSPSLRGVTLRVLRRCALARLSAPDAQPGLGGTRFRRLAAPPGWLSASGALWPLGSCRSGLVQTVVFSVRSAAWCRLGRWGAVAQMLGAGGLDVRRWARLGRWRREAASRRAGSAVVG